MDYRHIVMPAEGEKITIRDGKPQVPDHPIVGFIEGDGIGADIMKASLRAWDTAVAKAYGNRRGIHWCELYLGEKAGALYQGNFFPDETLAALKELVVSIKGPLTTPVGAAASAPSTWRCARTWTSTPACGRCATTRACRLRCAARKRWTW